MLRNVAWGAATAAALAWVARREVRRWRERGDEAPAEAPGQPPTVSVLVPTLNEAAYVEDACRSLALQSLRKRGAGGVEILLVDSGSDDGTVERARPWVDRVVRAPRGKLNALVAGINAARGDVIAEADADGRFPEHWLAHLVAPFSDPRVAASFGPVVYDDSPLWERLNPILLPVCDVVSKMPAGARAYRKSAWARAGGFRVDVDQSSILPLWLEEEFAFSDRLRGVGPVCFVPEAYCFKSARRLDPVFVRDTRAQAFREELAKGERFSLKMEHVPL